MIWVASLVVEVAEVLSLLRQPMVMYMAGPGGGGNPRSRSRCLMYRLPGPLHCVVAPDLVGITPALPPPFLLMALPFGPLVGVGATDLAFSAGGLGDSCMA
jgi:hypothetical protein